MNIGNVFTPTMALDKEITLIKRGKARKGPVLIIYSFKIGGMTRYCVTFNHVVVTITSFLNVAKYTYLKGDKVNYGYPS